LPVFLFFINSIASTVYLNSDTTILGLLCGDHAVGLYSVASKIYLIIKQLFNAVVFALIPCLASLAKKDNGRFFDLSCKSGELILALSVPAAVGLFFLRTDMVLLISGAALTTLVAESAIFLISFILVLKIKRSVITARAVFHVAIGTAFMAAVLFLLERWSPVESKVGSVLLSVCAGVGCYFISMRIMKDRIFHNTIKIFMEKADET